MEYDVSVWAEAVVHFNKWKESFQTTEAVTDPLVGVIYFVSSIWEKNKYRYSGIHELNERGEIIPNTGINLDNYEWAQIMENVSEIDAAIYGRQVQKGVKRNAPSDEIQMWSYQWISTGKPPANSLQLWFFTQDEARKHADMNKPTGKGKDKSKLELLSEYRSRPSAALQMSMAMYNLIIIAITRLKEKRCKGCQMTPPAEGQALHSEGGCLDYENGLFEVVTDCYEFVKVEDLEQLYNSVCRLIGVSPQGSTCLARAALEWITPERVTSVLEQMKGVCAQKPELYDDILLDCNTPLMDLVNGVSIELDMRSRVSKYIQQQ